jgi:hypothetical protein
MSSSGDERGPVELLADEFLARCKRGEKPTIRELTQLWVVKKGGDEDGDDGDKD